MIQDWMSQIEATMQHAKFMEGGAALSKPPPITNDHESNDDETAVEISSGPMFGLDDIDLDDV